MTTDPVSAQRPALSTFSRRAFFAGGAIVAAGAGLAFYSAEIERHFIEIVPQTFRIANLPAAFHGYRIAQLSDIHLEWFTEDFLLRHAVQKINALKPDLVLITGDYISNNSIGPDTRAYAAMPHCGEILSGIECPLRYGSLGNHDVEVDAAAVLSMLSTCGVTALVNSYVPIERQGQRLWLGGLDDVEAGHPDVSLAVPEKPGAPVILMCHEPDFMDDIAVHKRKPFIDLVLSGHSHGGQVRLPFKGALVLPPLGWKYSMGRYQFENTQLYVNRGLGTVGVPLRFNCPPEITHITLQPA